MSAKKCRRSLPSPVQFVYIRYYADFMQVKADKREYFGQTKDI